METEEGEEQEYNLIRKKAIIQREIRRNIENIKGHYEKELSKKCLEAWKNLKKREGKREGIEKSQIEEGEEKNGKTKFKICAKSINAHREITD